MFMLVPIFLGNFKSLRVYLPWVREIKSARKFSTSRVRENLSAQKFIRISYFGIGSDHIEVLSRLYAKVPYMLICPVCIDRLND